MAYSVTAFSGVVPRLAIVILLHPLGAQAASAAHRHLCRVLLHGRALRAGEFVLAHELAPHPLPESFGLNPDLPGHPDCDARSQRAAVRAAALAPLFLEPFEQGVV